LFFAVFAPIIELKTFPFDLTELWNSVGWKGLLEVTMFILCLKADPIRGGCPEPCPVQSWVSPRWETQISLAPIPMITMLMVNFFS